MSHGDEFELQREATTNSEREQGTEGGQKREHAGDGMAVAPKTLCFLTAVRQLSKQIQLVRIFVVEGLQRPVTKQLV